MLNETSRIEKKYCIISLICGTEKIQQISEYNNRNRLTGSEKLVVTSGKRGGAL